MTVLRVCYKQGRFDEKYYVSKHLPLAGSAMGPHGVTRVEVVKVLPSPDGSTPPYQMIFSAYFDSPANLQRAMAEAGARGVLADIQNFHDGTPDVLIGEVLTLPALA